MKKLTKNEELGALYLIVSITTLLAWVYSYNLATTKFASVYDTLMPKYNAICLFGWIIGMIGSTILVKSSKKNMKDIKHTNTKQEDRRCPNCGRAIPIDAGTCPYCSKKFW